MRVDTLVSAKDGDTVTERVIKVYGYYTVGIKPGDRRYLDFLDFINTHHTKYWAPQSLNIDDDGDLRFDWSINIPGAEYPVHAEQVADAISRTLSELRNHILPQMAEKGWIN